MIDTNIMENHYNLFLTVYISGEIIETAKLSSKQVAQKKKSDYFRNFQRPIIENYFRETNLF
jgi:hypothetical protein